MAFTEKQIHDLNNMNRAAQNVDLGNILNGNGKGVYVLPKASKEAIGGVKLAELVPDAKEETVTKAEFDALLKALKAAGIMAEA